MSEEVRYPHLMDVTGEGDTDRIYIKKLGVRDDELTEAEAFVIRRSEDYVNARDRKRARETFERLLQIEGMPVEAICIINKWIADAE